MMKRLMRKTEEFLFVCFLVLGMFLICPMSVNAESTANLDGLQVTIETDKESYEADEQMVLSVSIINQNQFDVDGVSLETLLPDGLEIVSGELSAKDIEIAAGESYKVTTMVKKTAKPVAEVEEEPEEAVANTDAEGTMTNNISEEIPVLYLIIGGAVVFFILLIVVIILIVKGKKKSKAKKALSLLLCASLTMSTLSMDASAAENDSLSVTVDKSVTVDSMEYLLQSTVTLSVLSGDKEYTVSFDLNYDGASENPEAQLVKNGEKATAPENPQRENYALLGWYQDRNEKDWTNFFHFNEEVIYQDVTLYAKWINISADTDGDGLCDDVEIYIGTDINLADTDGDGLTDYQESMEIGTSPILADTDNNGTTDYDEDKDGDTLSNGYEYSIGTSPVFTDSDFDGLIDNEEINTYGTSPILKDTDGDGAEDGWEVENGYDPKVAEATFVVTHSSEEVTAANTVSASADVTIKGNQIESLSVKPVSVVDNPMISHTVPGYLGSAYDFEVEGDIVSATLTFRYEKSLGEIGEEFQPRIYYFNEETKMFEELENQTVEEGVVTATTNHFSTYILLNKVEFDKVWEAEIEPPFAGEEGEENESKLAVAFVIDYSASMGENDSNKIFKTVTKGFVDKLRTGIDRAAVIKFIKTAALVSELTTDKEVLKTGIDSIKYDSGFGIKSGTDGSTGYKMALDELAKSDDDFKYIVLITDGEDTQFSYSYDDLIAQSVQQNIVVYTIGIGTASEAVLKKIAEGTGGKFYFATTDAENTEIEELDSVFGEIEQETINREVDTNQDGISDYYTELIRHGDLVLSNGSREFMNIDFNYDENGNLSNDRDGDGLLNGEEIQVVSKNGKVYLEMKSNPRMVHSDADGIDDKTEVSQGTDPMCYQMSEAGLDKLLNGFANYVSDVRSLQKNPAWNSDVWAMSVWYGVWNKDEIYRDIMINYFADYAKDEVIDKVENEYRRRGMLEAAGELFADISSVTSMTGEANALIEIISKLNGMPKGVSAGEIICANYNSLLLQIAEKLPNSSSTIRLYPLDQSIFKEWDMFSKGVTYTSYLIDFADTLTQFAKVNANVDVFGNNTDMLTDIKVNSGDDHAKDAARAILDTMSGELYEQRKALYADAAETAVNLVIEKMADAELCGKIMVAIKDGMNLVTGISTDLTQYYEMVCYERMTTAARSQFNMRVSLKDGYYYVPDEKDISDVHRFLVHLAQLRVLGTAKCYDFRKREGLQGLLEETEDHTFELQWIVEDMQKALGEVGLKMSDKVVGIPEKY